MNIFKKKSFYFLLLVVFAGGYFGYNSYRKSKLPPVYDTLKVERGSLVQTVDATGKIESAQDLSLKFEIPGILSVLKVKEGNKVKTGALLATLRLAELNAAVSQAQANLNKQLAGSTYDYIAQLKASLDKAKNDLMQAQGDGDGVENSKLVQNAYDDLVANLQSVQIVLASSLTAADNILGIDNTFANDSFETSLSLNDFNILLQAKTKYGNTKEVKNIFDQAVNGITKNSAHEKIDQVTKQAETAMLTMKDCLFYISSVLDNTPPVGALSQSSLDTMKTNLQTTRTTLSTKFSAITDDVHDIATARNNYFSYKALVDKAQAALNDAQNPPREVDVASYRAALQQALANRDKAIINAPIDGIITEINNKVGEAVNSTDSVIKLLSPHYEINVDVSETDIAKIELNDSVIITLDAFGDETKFSGKVFNIDPAATIIQDVVYYKVKISLDDTDKAIKPGMTANVIIKTDSRDNILIIPSRAIRTNGEKQVRILENGQEKLVPIKLGMKGDEGKVEVLDGLQEGQEIILGIKNVTK
jgi:HlyD family secretion protein